LFRNSEQNNYRKIIIKNALYNYKILSVEKVLNIIEDHRAETKNKNLNLAEGHAMHYDQVGKKDEILLANEKLGVSSKGNKNKYNEGR
jgi:hypothetical protein